MAPEISVIAPLLNEEQNVYELYRRITATLQKTGSSYEIILVDDGSRDNTFYLLEKIASEDSHVRYIRFSRNFGHQVALFAGLEKAKGEKVVLMDGDLQDPPEVIADLIEKLTPDYDVVYAKRITRKGETFLKKATAKAFYRTLNRLTSISIPLDTGDFRIMRRNVIKELLKMNDQNKFLRGQIAWLGFKETYIPYAREERKLGTTHFSSNKMFLFAFDGITGFSNLPLKFASFGGIIISFLAFIFIIYVFIQKLFFGHTVSGWASLMVTVLFMGGIQLLSLGIIGEYISRINDSVRNRQLYVIEKTNIDSTVNGSID